MLREFHPQCAHPALSAIRVIVAGAITLSGVAPAMSATPRAGATPAAAPPVAVIPDPNPATFSVSGPVDPNTAGILFPRGGPVMPQVPIQPGNPFGFAIRAAGIPPAVGLPTARPGDVNDYIVMGVPSEAVFFQSEPGGGQPAGTNNQILESASAGLVSGPGVPSPSWVAPAPRRDDIDAISFGEDYFSPAINVGLDPTTGFPPPPSVAGPFGTKVGVAPTGWATRVSVYREPMVIDDGPGERFLFSVDPWAIGAPGTWVNSESGGADLGGGIGPWVSTGSAAGDIFSTDLIARAGGLSVGGAMNYVEDNNPLLALAPPNGGVLTPNEDDLDGLECVGPSSDWLTAVALTPGSIRDRTNSVLPGLGVPGAEANEPMNSRPVFFSVKRSSTGTVGSAVWSQFVNDGGAAADIFVTAKDPTAPPGVGTNLLFADEAELGLLAIDNSPGGTGPADISDDLNALLLYVTPSYRPVIVKAIDEIMGGAPYFTMGGAFPWTPGPLGSMTGGGMTISILQYLRLTGRPMASARDVQCAFSVSTDAVGQEFSAVDYEAGSVGLPGGPETAACDIFYASLDGTASSGNYLWHDGTALGLNEGSFVPGVSGNLADLPDNLNALDSDANPPRFVRTEVGGAIGAPGETDGGFAFLPSQPNPFTDATSIRYALPADGSVRLAVYDVSGKRITTLVDGRENAGEHSASWDGQTTTGRRAAPGIYYARLEAGGKLLTHRMVLVR